MNKFELVWGFISTALMLSPLIAFLAAIPFFEGWEFAIKLYLIVAACMMVAFLVFVGFMMAIAGDLAAIASSFKDRR